MPLKSSRDIGPRKPFPPDSELEVANYAKSRRDLLRGNFVGLGVEPIVQDSTIPTGLAVNWFRRAADFLSEFLFADPPTVTTGMAALDGPVASWWLIVSGAVQVAYRDMLALGEGVLASHPLDPAALQRWERDQAFEVQDVWGSVTEDIMVARRGDYMDVIRYPVAVPASRWNVYRGEQGMIGAAVDSRVLDARSGRQVVKFRANPEGKSLFDPMAPHVGEMSRVLAALSGTLERNHRPHLYGPDGALTLAEDGTVQLNVDGMYFPLQPEDSPPGYLQWDSDLDAVKWQYRQAETNALTMAGLTIALFDPQLLTGVLSGTALRRLTLPFQAMLAHLSNIGEDLIWDLMHLWMRNAAPEGAGTLKLNRADFTVEWAYDDLFSDEVQDSGRETDPEAREGRETNSE